MIKKKIDKRAYELVIEADRCGESLTLSEAISLVKKEKIENWIEED